MREFSKIAKLCLRLGERSQEVASKPNISCFIDIDVSMNFIGHELEIANHYCSVFTY